MFNEESIHNVRFTVLKCIMAFTVEKMKDYHLEVIQKYFEVWLKYQSKAKLNSLSQIEIHKYCFLGKKNS